MPISRRRRWDDWTPIESNGSSQLSPNLNWLEAETGGVKIRRRFTLADPGAEENDVNRQVSVSGTDLRAYEALSGAKIERQLTGERQTDSHRSRRLQTATLDRAE